MNYASSGQGALGVTLGAIGTGLGVLNGGAGLLNMNPNVHSTSDGDRPVTRYEHELQMQLAAEQQKVAILESDKYTDQKLVEVYAELAKKDAAIRDIISANQKEQYGINTAQAVLNGTTGATIQCLQNQITQLQSLTKLVIPNASVSPGWTS